MLEYISEKVIEIARKYGLSADEVKLIKKWPIGACIPVSHIDVHLARRLFQKGILKYVTDGAGNGYVCLTDKAIEIILALSTPQQDFLRSRRLPTPEELINYSDTNKLFREIANEMNSNLIRKRKRKVFLP